MCGIAGKIDFSGPVDQAVVAGMCARMEHRGPDSDGYHREDGAVLGMRRLAIIDVAHGDQPAYNEDRSVAVVFNGEIYNFQELRADLERRGHRLDSHADGEVLPHLYEEHGERFVDHLRGMFAIAVWDVRRRKLVLARDRVGKKPLFWSRRGSTVWFSSTLVGLLEDPEISRAIDERAVDAYLALQYVPHPLTIFRDISKLPPASTLAVTAENSTERRYWRLSYEDTLAGIAEEEAAELVLDKLREATRMRLISEVPLGAFLSGGIDSSAVVFAMAEATSEPVKTFSIGFGDEAFDEVHYARQVAELFATDHHELRVEPEALSIMPRLAYHYGEPFGDPSAIPSFYLAEMTSKHVTVALNGDGGDESFAGYGRYARQARLRRTDALPRPVRRAAAAALGAVPADERVTTFPSRARRFGRVLRMSPWERYATTLVAFDAAARERLLTGDLRARLGPARAEDMLADSWQSAPADDELERMLALDVETYLPGDLLVKMDVATMASSVEGRSPFLDHELMELAASLPAGLKLAGGDGKRVLKRALRGTLPDEILDRRKMGFGVPLVRWFREELHALPGEMLLDRASLAAQWFERDEVERLIGDHHAGRADNSLKLWVLLQLETWHREVLTAPSGVGAA